MCTLKHSKQDTVDVQYPRVPLYPNHLHPLTPADVTLILISIIMFLLPILEFCVSGPILNMLLYLASVRVIYAVICINSLLIF